MQKMHAYIINGTGNRNKIEWDQTLTVTQSPEDVQIIKPFDINLELELLTVETKKLPATRLTSILFKYSSDTFKLFYLPYNSI